MSARPRVPAYVALARSIFDHYLFNGQRQYAYSWREAWEWLFTHAAWRPSGQRMSRGIADRKRGQIAVTLRGLAAQWGWSVGRVQYFLHRLREENMIESIVIDSKIDSSSGPRSSYRATVITICNYEKFQKMSAAAGRTVSQRSNQGPIQSGPELPGFESKKPIEQPNHFTIDSPTQRQGAYLYKPHHLATSKDRRWLWCDYGTDDWRVSNADYRDIRGADIMPEKRIGGRGNWFYKLGEAYRPKRRRRTA